MYVYIYIYIYMSTPREGTEVEADDELIDPPPHRCLESNSN